jgi:hypothetical protein
MYTQNSFCKKISVLACSKLNYSRLFLAKAAFALQNMLKKGVLRALCLPLRTKLIPAAHAVESDS